MRSDLPPEAFTKNTLQQAFEWLQTQPEAMRATVHTPERLVSLFHQSQRNDAPVSSKLFVDDLKSLASSLDQFSETPTTTTSPSSPPVFFNEPVEQKVPKKPTPASLLQKPKASAPPQGEEFDMDEISRQRVAKVRKRFNLGSDCEALRLLISLGFEKFEQL